MPAMSRPTASPAQWTGTDYRGRQPSRMTKPCRAWSLLRFHFATRVHTPWLFTSCKHAKFLDSQQLPFFLWRVLQRFAICTASESSQISSTDGKPIRWQECILSVTNHNVSGLGHRLACERCCVDFITGQCCGLAIADD